MDEVCCGCGRVAKADDPDTIQVPKDAAKPKSARVPAFPVMVVVRNTTTSTFELHPVCRNCHQDPAHRTRHIKGHFFLRGEAPRGLLLAGSSSAIGG